MRGGDGFFERLLYLQAEDDAILQGHITLDDEEKVVACAGMAMAIAYGDDLGYTVEDIVESKVSDFVIPEWRTKKSPNEWAKLIYELRDTLVAADPEDLQESFLQLIQSSPLYGTHWFYVYKIDPAGVVPGSIRSLPKELMFGFNMDGMTIYNLQHKPQVSFPYADIVRWNGASTQFHLILNSADTPEPFELAVHTGQAADMASIILDFIKAIMVEQESTSA